MKEEKSNKKKEDIEIIFLLVAAQNAGWELVMDLWVPYICYGTRFAEIKRLSIPIFV
jgi:hypothetical protein